MQEFNAVEAPERFLYVAHAMGYTNIRTDAPRAVRTVLRRIRRRSSGSKSDIMEYPQQYIAVNWFYLPHFPLVEQIS